MTYHSSITTWFKTKQTLSGLLCLSRLFDLSINITIQTLVHTKHADQGGLERMVSVGFLTNSGAVFDCEVKTIQTREI